MLVPQDKLLEAKIKYDGQAIQEICNYFGIEFNEKSKNRNSKQFSFDIL